MWLITLFLWIGAVLVVFALLAFLIMGWLDGFGKTSIEVAREIPKNWRSWLLFGPKLIWWLLKGIWKSVPLLLIDLERLKQKILRSRAMNMRWLRTLGLISLALIVTLVIYHFVMSHARGSTQTVSPPPVETKIVSATVVTKETTVSADDTVDNTLIYWVIVTIVVLVLAHKAGWLKKIHWHLELPKVTLPKGYGRYLALVVFGGGLLAVAIFFNWIPWLVQRLLWKESGVWVETHSPLSYGIGLFALAILLGLTLRPKPRFHPFRVVTWGLIVLHVIIGQISGPIMLAWIMIQPWWALMTSFLAASIFYREDWKAGMIGHFIAISFIVIAIGGTAHPLWQAAGEHTLVPLPYMPSNSELISNTHKFVATTSFSDVKSLWTPNPPPSNVHTMHYTAPVVPEGEGVLITIPFGFGYSYETDGGDVYVRKDGGPEILRKYRENLHLGTSVHSLRFRSATSEPVGIDFEIHPYKY